MGGGALSSKNVSKLGSKEVSKTKIAQLVRDDMSIQVSDNVTERLDCHVADAPRNDSNRHAELVSASQNDTFFSRFTSHFSRKRVAFTLAEVLITLGIIGVVAALTIPPLVQNHKKQVAEVRLKRVANVLTGAFKLAENDYGEAISWDTINSPDAIKKYLMPYIPGSKFIDEGHMKLIRVYSSDKSSSMTLNSGWSSGLKLKTGEVLKLNDGINENNDLIQIGVLLPQNKLETYISGKDYFVYFIDKRKGVAGAQPWSEYWNVSCNKDVATQTLFCKTSPWHSANCLALIECNGWKIPDDYPIKF